MKAGKFREWREHLGLSQGAAAERLGLSRVTVAMYERGERRDRPGCRVVIPLHVELACAAVALGIRGYAGPD